MAFRIPTTILSVSSLVPTSTQILATQITQVTTSTNASATPTVTSRYDYGNRTGTGYGFLNGTRNGNATTVNGPANGLESGMGSHNGQGSGSNQSLVITVLSSAIGSIILAMAGLILWHYHKRYQKRLNATRLEETPDENDFEKWRSSTLPPTPTCGEQWAPVTPSAAQRHITKRYYSQPMLFHTPDITSPRSSSVSGLLTEKEPFDDKPHGYRGLPFPCHSNTSMRGYMQHRAERSRSSQSTTLLSGVGQTPGEVEEVPQVPNHGNHRAVRPRSIPLSPLAGSSVSSEFDFGFDKKPVTSRSERVSSSISSTASLMGHPVAPPKQF